MLSVAYSCSAYVMYITCIDIVPVYTIETSFNNKFSLLTNSINLGHKMMKLLP